jgi:hypothetical protein
MKKQLKRIARTHGRKARIKTKVLAEILSASTDKEARRCHAMILRLVREVAYHQQQAAVISGMLVHQENGRHEQAR